MTLTRPIALLLAAVLAVPAVAGADPLDRKQIPADAKWVAHVDVEAAVASPLGQFLLDKLAGDDLAARREALVARIGFDPLKDLRSVTLYGADYKPASAVAIIRVAADKALLLKLLDATGTHELVKLDGREVHKWVDPKAAEHERHADRFGCFLRDDLIVIAGNLDSLKAALAVLEGKADSVEKNEPFAAVLTPAAGTGLFLAARDIELPPEAPRRSLLLDKLAALRIQTAQINDKLTVDVQVTAKDQDSADRMANVVRGLLALAGLAAERGERGISPIRLPREALELLAKVNVTQDELNVRLQAAWPIDAVQKVIELRMRARAAVEAARAAEGTDAGR